MSPARTRRWLALAGLIMAACASPYRPPPPFPIEAPPPPVAVIELSRLPGWSAEDHLHALDAWRQTCSSARESRWSAVCARARAAGPLTASAARRFFEDNLVAEVIAGEGLLTAYYAPVYPARTRPDAEFSAAVRPRPADLKSLGASVVQVRPDGAETPYPDRAAIETKPEARPLAWMRPEELFFLQIQGSGVLTFETGARMKASYAAHNGQPFVGVANIMRDRGLLPRDQTSGEAIRAWLAANRGPRADEIMRLNPRYAFFRLGADDGRPPVGAAGVPLPAGRAIAIDPAFHGYGGLFWIDGEAPLLAGAFPRYQRLAAALDTGGAIKGEVRADLYLGEGSAAGVEAGRVRHRLRLYRLAPR